jgi:uncharacterized coiled-coil DUF342 family protein
MNIRGELAQLGRKIDTLKNKRSETEGQLTALTSQQDSIYTECRKLGIEPEKLGEVIVEKEQELEKMIKSIKREVETIENKYNEVTQPGTGADSTS